MSMENITDEQAKAQLKEYIAAKKAELAQSQADQSTLVETFK